MRPGLLPVLQPLARARHLAVLVDVRDAVRVLVPDRARVDPAIDASRRARGRRSPRRLPGCDARQTLPAADGPAIGSRQTKPSPPQSASCVQRQRPSAIAGCSRPQRGRAAGSRSRRGTARRRRSDRPRGTSTLQFVFDVLTISALKSASTSAIDRVLVPGARRAIARVQDLAGEAVVDAREALVAVDDLGAAVAVEVEHRRAGHVRRAVLRRLRPQHAVGRHRRARAPDPACRRSPDRTRCTRSRRRRRTRRDRRRRSRRSSADRRCRRCRALRAFAVNTSRPSRVKTVRDAGVDERDLGDAVERGCDRRRRSPGYVPKSATASEAVAPPGSAVLRRPTSASSCPSA